MLASLACSFVLAEYNTCESFQDLVLPDRRKGVDKINVHRRLLTVFIFPVAIIIIVLYILAHLLC